jgi:hypothetical protein
MTESISDICGELIRQLRRSFGLYQEPSWELKQKVLIGSSIPMWASVTALSILGNMNEDDCNKYYPYIKRRLRTWANIPGSTWEKLEHKLNLHFLNLAERNLIAICSPNQRALPWIKATLDTKNSVMSALQNGKIDLAKTEAQSLTGFDANHAKLMNYPLAEATERLAAAVIAAAKLKGGVPEVAANAIADGPFELRDHPLGWFISFLDDKAHT